MNTAPELGQETTPAVVNRVMVVDDDPDTVLFLRTLLEREGFVVFVAKDGGQAHSMFTMRQPDFVILDLMLAGNETGFEVCERLKQTHRRIPVMILSAVDLDRSRNLAKRVGADAYLLKPVEPNLLIEEIRRVSEDVWQRTQSESRPTEVKLAVRFACRCGKRFKVAQQHRGKTLTCPNCGEPVVVPRHD